MAAVSPWTHGRWIWEKLSAAKWLDAREERFLGNPNLVIHVIKGGKTLRVEVFRASRDEAVDRALSPSQIRKVSKFSPRIRVQGHCAQVDWRWGDFKQDPISVLEEYFDVFAYEANRGQQRVAMRSSSEAPDLRAWVPRGSGSLDWQHQRLIDFAGVDRYALDAAQSRSGKSGERCPPAPDLGAPSRASADHAGSSLGLVAC